MALLMGTLDGLYRASDVPFDHVERVLDGASGAYSSPSTNEVYARADGDLYRSTDNGISWKVVGTPPGHLTAFQASPGSESLFIGTYPPAELHVSHDSGTSWQTLESFPEFPAVERYVPGSGDLEVIREGGGAVHDIRFTTQIPDRIMVGIEPQGILVSDDGGETWTSRRYGIHGDVHDIEVLGPSEYLVATGQGLYHTGDAGRSWTRLDTSQTYFEYTYYHGVIVRHGSVSTAAATSSPGSWSGEYGANAVLLTSDDLGDTFRHEAYPGGPDEIILGWASVDGQVVAGTMAQDWDVEGTTEARVIERTDVGWQTAGRVPAGVITIAVT